MRVFHAAALGAALLLPAALNAETIPFSDIENEAVNVLSAIQPRSIRERREYCGYILYYRGDVVSSGYSQGTHDSCDIQAPPPRAQVLASFHTHGNHDPEYYSEVPSDLDVAGDFDEGVYGFVGTPGGRVWLIDPFQEEIFQLCGEGCIPSDAQYNADDYEPIPEAFTPNELIEFFE